MPMLCLRGERHGVLQELQALADTVGVVSKGLSAGAIAALPAHTYSAPQMVTRSSTAQAESCAVCCEDLQVPHASQLHSGVA